MKVAVADGTSPEAKIAVAALGFGSRLAYRVEDFVAVSGIGRTTIYAEIKAGRLKAKKVGKRTIITAEAGKAYLDSLPEMQAA